MTQRGRVAGCVYSVPLLESERKINTLPWQGVTFYASMAHIVQRNDIERLATGSDSVYGARMAVALMMHITDWPVLAAARSSEAGKGK